MGQGEDVKKMDISEKKTHIKQNRNPTRIKITINTLMYFISLISM